MPTTLDAVLLDSADPAALGAWWAGLLGWSHVLDHEGDARLDPPDGAPGLRIDVLHDPDPAAGTHRLHLDLRSGSASEQAELVARAERAGARRIDVGQGDVPWVVLADPEGTRFCVLEPREVYAGTGALAAVVVQALDPARLAAFWAEATGRPVTASGPDFASLAAPDGAGPALEFVTVPHLPAGKNRVHLDVRPEPGGDRHAEVTRLLALGAVPLEIGQSADPAGTASWTVLADPEGGAFCVLNP